MRLSTKRVLAGLLGLSALYVGIWASIAPHSFFTTFPGPGHHWVLVLPPYSEHRATVDRFRHATTGGRIEDLLAVLDPDVVLGQRSCDRSVGSRRRRWMPSVCRACRRVRRSPVQRGSARMVSW
jgi:hypothetical protein